MMTTITKEPRTEALRLRREGMSKADIARELGVHPATVQSWLPPEKLADDRALLVKMRALAAQGMPHAHIARTLGVSRANVTALIGPANPPPSHSNESKAFVLGSPETFDRVRAIAKRLGAITYQGRGAGNGSLAVLLQWIADGKLAVVRAEYGAKENDNGAHRSGNAG